MTTPAHAAPTDEERLERPHPLSPIVRTWIWLVGLAVYFGRDSLERLAQGEPLTMPSNARWMAVGLGGLLSVFVVLGFISWRTTRFVVDDVEVRIEHRFVWHSSDRIGFAKIQSVDIAQPFAARLLGLAALHIDVGAGHPKEIAYLTRSRAVHLRDFLLARAHRGDATLAEAAQRPAAGILEDLAVTDRIVVRVHPGTLVLGTVVSHEFVVLVVMNVLVGVVPVLITDSLAAGLAALPLFLSLAGFVTHRVVKQWNFTLADTGHGLRVARGLTSLESQSLPVDRIQGVVLEQSVLGRLVRLYRVKLDVLGKHGAGDSASSDVLLPAGTWSQVLVALDTIWPGFNPEQVPLRRIPARARWLRWLDAQVVRWGYDETVIMARHGLLVTRTTIVHHARAQSVALLQGPIERALRLAQVAVHTTPGPVVLVCVAMDEQEARALALSELDRAGWARQQERQLRLATAAEPVTPSA